MIIQVKDILNSKCGNLNQHLSETKKKIVKPRNDCPEVVKMHWDLKYWCLEKGIKFRKEYHFAKGRRYRFDFCIPDYKLGIEYDGLNSVKSGHTTLIGYTSDTEKLNLAVKEGWTVLRYTVLNYRNVLQDLEKIIYGKV